MKFQKALILAFLKGKYYSTSLKCIFHGILAHLWLEMTLILPWSWNCSSNQSLSLARNRLGWLKFFVGTLPLSLRDGVHGNCLRRRCERRDARPITVKKTNFSLRISTLSQSCTYTSRLDGIPRTSEAATRRVEAFDSLVGSGTALFLCFVTLCYTTSLESQAELKGLLKNIDHFFVKSISRKFSWNRA